MRLTSFTLLLLFLFAASCKKDKNTTEPKLDPRLVGAWNYSKTINDPDTDPRTINKAFLFQENTDYMWKSITYNNSGIAIDSAMNEGTATVSSPEDTISKYLSEHYKKTIMINIKLNTFETAYIEFLDQNTTFIYYWFESDGMVYMNEYKKTQ